jgi:hypothetical protein
MNFSIYQKNFDLPKINECLQANSQASLMQKGKSKQFLIYLGKYRCWEAIKKGLSL